MFFYVLMNFHIPEVGSAVGATCADLSSDSRRLADFQSTPQEHQKLGVNSMNHPSAATRDLNSEIPFNTK
jgi:hypothetical protein